MAGSNESNAIIIDSDEEEEVMDLQESVTQEDATCFAMCSGSASGRRVGNEATTSSTNTKDSEAEGTSTVSSVSRAGDTNVSLPCACLGCSNFSIPHQPQELPQSNVSYSGIQVKLSNTVEPYSHHGTTNIPGLLCVQISTKYFVECVA